MEELSQLIRQNSSNQLYNAQFQLLTSTLKEEYALLSAEKLKLYRTHSDPINSSRLHAIDKRIEANRAEIMKIYSLTVSSGWPFLMNR